MGLLPIWHNSGIPYATHPTVLGLGLGLGLGSQLGLGLGLWLGLGLGLGMCVGYNRVIPTNFGVQLLVRGQSSYFDPLRGAYTDILDIINQQQIQ